MGAKQRGASTLEHCASRPHEANSARRLVIIADDSLTTAALQIGFRQSLEFELVGHADPLRTSALAILRAEPDVILLDDLGQSERAIELLRELREQNDEIVVLILSVRLDPEWLDQLFDAGASGAISKATPPQALMTLVRETLNGHIVHRPATASPVSESPDAAGARADLPLTAREAEILQLVASGSTNGDIARRLWVTEATVKFHLRNIYRKLDVANRTEASHFAHVRGLVMAAPTLDLTTQDQLSVVS